MVKTSVVNIVATTSINQPVDIRAAGRIDGFLYDPKKYGGRVVYYKDKEMTGRVTLFPSGKIISVGTRTIKDATNNVARAVRILVRNKLAQKTDMPRMRIQNIVASVDFETRIDLEEASVQGVGIYEPEQFPGLMLRLDDPKAVILLFASGKAVITGFNDLKKLDRIVDVLSGPISSGPWEYSPLSIAYHAGSNDA